MPRIFLLFAIFFVNIASTLAQDVITLKNGDEIQAIVQDIGIEEVKYKRFDNPNGPNYTLKKSDVFMVRYVNGSKDVFTEQQNPNIEKKDDMQHTERSQRALSITAINDTKELEQVLAEAFEKISTFEKSCAQLMRAEGIVDFYENRAKRYSVQSQIFSELTGGMTFEDVNIEIDKRLGSPATLREKMLVVYGGDDPYGGTRLRLKDEKNWKIFSDSYRKESAELIPAIERMVEEMEQSAVMQIPDSYRYPLALSTMLGLVKNYRASTWKECADKYEEQFHRWIMEANSAESLQIQKEIRNLTGQVARNTAQTARNTRATAIFTGLMYLGL